MTKITDRNDKTDQLQAEPMLLLEYPPELPPLAREEWNRIVGELTALGVLSKFDRGALAVYCGAYALWAEAMEAVQKFGSMIKSPNGYPVQSPYLATLNRQADTMMRIACEFGFTPAARSRNFSYTKANSMLLEYEEESEIELREWPVLSKPKLPK
jgi:P27 family predicted phage terminase small subunit